MDPRKSCWMKAQLMGILNNKQHYFLQYFKLSLKWGQDHKHKLHELVTDWKLLVLFPPHVLESKKMSRCLFSLDITCLIKLLWHRRGKTDGKWGIWSENSISQALISLSGKNAKWSQVKWQLMSWQSGSFRGFVIPWTSAAAVVEENEWDFLKIWYRPLGGNLSYSFSGRI